MDKALEAYDWSKADWISVRRGRSEKYAFRGVCKAPRNGSGYRINCTVSPVERKVPPVDTIFADCLEGDRQPLPCDRRRSGRSSWLVQTFIGLGWGPTGVNGRSSGVQDNKMV